MTPGNPPPSLLIAFGGNALNLGDHPHQREEFQQARRSMKQVILLLEQGYEKIIISHGNGPQVGQIYLQQELTRNEFPRQVTLDVCVADSQGRIGYVLQNVFDNVCQERGIDKKSFSIITQVVVAQDDPAFNKPSKPIGVFYTPEEALRLTNERGWVMIEDAGRGFRRVVPSPEPLEIVEKKIFSELLNLGFIAIGAGGGGIPVVRKSSGDIEGVEAVIDKDKTSALLASATGIDIFLMLTAVDAAYLHFNSSRQKRIARASAAEMENYLEQGHFLEGSMKPKVEAALAFIKKGGKKAIIANINDTLAAVEGTAGTQIYPS
jgi:carbamate kinase